MAEAIKHTLPDLLRQRIFGLALGYEDLIDHDALRFDPALAAVIDKPGGALAGKSTLNRLEHASKIGRDRHHKLDHDGAAIERLFVDLFLEAHREPPMRIVIDLDATDDPLYGEQEGRQFHGSTTATAICAVHFLRPAFAGGEASIFGQRCRRRRGASKKTQDPSERRQEIWIIE